MRECPIGKLKPGMVLGQPLHAYYGARRSLLLGRGAEITPALIDRLLSIGYPAVYIEEEGTEDIAPGDILAEETTATAMQTVSEFYNEFHDILKDLAKDHDDLVTFFKKSSPFITVPRTSGLKQCVNDIKEDLFIIGSVGRYKTNSAIPRTNAIHQHAINTTILSLLLGWHFDFTDDELFELGLGALLHDIGKLAMPELMEKKYWELNSEERLRLRDHAVVGESMLANSRPITEMNRQIIMQHHEYQDGTGYPTGLKGNNRKPIKTLYTEPNQIFRFAEIVAVANTFDNLMSGEFTQSLLSPKKAYMELKKDAVVRYNSEIVSLIQQVVDYYPVGSNVRVVKHPNHDYQNLEGVVAKSDGEQQDQIELVLLFDANGKRIPSQRVFLDLKEAAIESIDEV